MPRNLATQGYRLGTERQRELRVGLRFPTAVCVLLVATGLLLRAPLLLALLAAIAAVGGFASRHPFDHVWNHGVRRLVRAPALPASPVRRRHAFKVAAVLLLAVAVLFWVHRPQAALVLGGLMLPLCALVTVAYLCVPSEVLAGLERRNARTGRRSTDRPEVEVNAS